jgi:hypothetical protein
MLIKCVSIEFSDKIEERESLKNAHNGNIEIVADAV